jgi:hypothetical protein
MKVLDLHALGVALHNFVEKDEKVCAVTSPAGPAVPPWGPLRV